MKMKQITMQLFCTLLLISLLTPFAFATETEYRYGLSFNYGREYELEINGVKIEQTDEIVLTSEDRVKIVDTLIPEGGSSSGVSEFLYFMSSDGTEDNPNTYWRHDVLSLPDDTLLAIKPLREIVTFENMYVTEPVADLQFDYYTADLHYDFYFEGEYDAVPVTFEEVRAAGIYDWQNGKSLWEQVDTSNSFRLLMRGEMHSAGISVVSFSDGVGECFLAVTPYENVVGGYEINAGNGWQPISLIPGMENATMSVNLIGGVGRTFVNNGWYITTRLAYGETPTVARIDSERDEEGNTIPSDPDGDDESLHNDTAITAGAVAITTILAATGSAVTISAVGATASTSASAFGSVSDGEAEPSILINGGGSYPKLANTKKATAELFLSVDNSFGKTYKWSAIATVPDCLKAVTAAAVPPIGESSNAVLMISGTTLPKKSVPVFIDVSAVDADGETLTAFAELTLYEKGLFVELSDKSRPDRPESYNVTRISDGNFDGLAEIKSLKATEYTVELQDGKAVIHFGEETASVDV